MRASTNPTEQMVVVIDSREQQPYQFQDFDVETNVAALKTGDYSLLGRENKVAIERKNPMDFLSCVGGQRSRFERELLSGKPCRWKRRRADESKPLNR